MTSSQKGTLTIFTAKVDLRTTPKATFTANFYCEQKMEICEQNEAFVEEDGDLAFHHTKIILRDGNQYYYALTEQRY